MSSSEPFGSKFTCTTSPFHRFLVAEAAPWLGSGITPTGIGVPLGAEAAVADGDGDGEAADATGVSAVTTRMSSAAISAMLRSLDRVRMRGNLPVRKTAARGLLCKPLAAERSWDASDHVHPTTRGADRYCFTVRSMPLYHCLLIAVSEPSECIVWTA